MTHAEFVWWREFYKLHPFDDHHRYHRPAALVSASMGGDVESKLNWLSPPVWSGEYGEADMNTIKAFGFSRPGG